jgi:monoamine oxidase
MGASWIHGVAGNPLTALADAAGADRVATEYDSAAAFSQGREIDYPAEPWDLLAKAQEMSLGAKDDLSLADAIAGLPEWSQLTPGDQLQLRLAVHRAVEHEYAGDWSQLSARTFDAAQSFEGGDVLLPGGYDALATHAAKGLDIRFGALVTQVRATSAGVELRFADGQVVAAEAAVITLPLGVLKSGTVVFDPPLDPARSQAIGSLGMGVLNKCWLRFDAPPPVPPVDWIGNFGPTAPAWAEWLNGVPSLGLPLLLGFNAAATAKETEALSDAETLTSASETLRSMFGSAFPGPRAAQVSRWLSDPLALGSYSFHAVGTGPATRRALSGADWDGRLVFGGEATSIDHPSTVHGAWLSGLDAALALR